MSKKMPSDIFVYVCDYDAGEPLYAVALTVEDIPSDCDGEEVASYSLNRVFKFKIRRELT